MAQCDFPLTTGASVVRNFNPWVPSPAFQKSVGSLEPTEPTLITPLLLTLKNALDVLIVAYQTNQNSLFEIAFEFAREKKGKLKADKWNEMIRKHPTLIAKAMSRQTFGIA